MSCKKLLILLLVGLLAVKTTNAQDLGELNQQISETLEYVAEHNPDSLSAVTEKISEISQEIMNAQGNPSLVSELTAKLKSVLAYYGTNTSCGLLKTGQQYYLKSADSKFAVVQSSVHQALMNWASTSPSTFYVVKWDCNLYGLCVNGYCMSRCEGCQSLLHEYQNVQFHLPDANNPWSQWTVSPIAGRAGLYNLKIDANFGYLTYKNTANGTALLTLDTQVTENSNFKLIELPEEYCGVILENGKQYYIQQADFRYAVLDPVKKLAFMRNVTQANASKFTVVQKSCDVYGLCVGSNCMSRCEGCPSDTGDQQTVRFHLSNTDLAWSQWALSPPSGEYGGPYSLTAEPQYGKLVFKSTEPGHEDQLTLEVINDITWQNKFEFIDVN